MRNADFLDFGLKIDCKCHMLPPWMLMSSKTEPKPDQWTKIKGQTENERVKNGENLVDGERFRKDVKTAENI
ncbi:hypothetical protein B9H02_07570 [Prosthecochloris sp. HL-130-GSB]|nr:hypothetical protein B9H02_07570 [Prosthecochloris sp. HL-130-GSB]